MLMRTKSAFLDIGLGNNVSTNKSVKKTVKWAIKCIDIFTMWRYNAVKM